MQQRPHGAENVAATDVVALIDTDTGVQAGFALVVGAPHQLGRDFQSLLARPYVLINQRNNSTRI